MWMIRLLVRYYEKRILWGLLGLPELSIVVVKSNVVNNGSEWFIISTVSWTRHDQAKHFSSCSHCRYQQTISSTINACLADNVIQKRRTRAGVIWRHYPPDPLGWTIPASTKESPKQTRLRPIIKDDHPSSILTSTLKNSFSSWLPHWWTAHVAFWCGPSFKELAPRAIQVHWSSAQDGYDIMVVGRYGYAYMAVAQTLPKGAFLM